MRSRKGAEHCGDKASESQADCLAALLGAFAAEISPADPDLAKLVTAWPTLPDALKAGIVSMVKAVGLTAAGEAERKGTPTDSGA